MTRSLQKCSEVTDTFVSDLYALQAKLLPSAPVGASARIANVRYSAEENSNHVLWSAPIGGS